MSPSPHRDYGVRMRTVLTEPFRLRTWRETAWAVLALWIGVFWFCVLVTLLAVGIGLAITIVGLPILAVTLLVATWGARLERSLARGLLQARVDEPPAEPEEGKESWRRVLQLPEGMGPAGARRHQTHAAGRHDPARALCAARAPDDHHRRTVG